ncbi:hypothetical protein CLOM_g8728 [Closterium sp. NIES-68]|nr:hypothetical protein CLOM_g8728 [Closterium sp. NIES-68]GJP68602.1 hypothetical protein CLOP_g25282 [Closterium sp. NIES-67]
MMGQARCDDDKPRPRRNHDGSSDISSSIHQQLATSRPNHAAVTPRAMSSHSLASPPSTHRLPQDCGTTTTLNAALKQRNFHSGDDTNTQDSTTEASAASSRVSCWCVYPTRSNAYWRKSLQAGDDGADVAGGPKTCACSDAARACDPDWVDDARSRIRRAALEVIEAHKKFQEHDRRVSRAEHESRLRRLTYSDEAASSSGDATTVSGSIRDSSICSWSKTSSRASSRPSSRASSRMSSRASSRSSDWPDFPALEFYQATEQNDGNSLTERNNNRDCSNSKVCRGRRRLVGTARWLSEMVSASFTMPKLA